MTISEESLTYRPDYRILSSMSSQLAPPTETLLSCRTEVEMSDARMTVGTIRFPIFIYPFEATHIAPSTGGGAIESIRVEGPGIDVNERGPSQELARDDILWWLSVDYPWLMRAGIDEPRRITQYDLEFLVTALNICLNTKVFATRFARRYYRTIELEGEFDNLSHGFEFARALTVSTSLPERLYIDSGELNSLFREMLDVLAGGDEAADLQKAIDSYRSAMHSFDTGIHARLLYSVCENVLLSGYADADDRDKAIADVSSLDLEEAASWRHLVNRTKHPDRGTGHSWDDAFEDIPPPIEFRMREAANEALKSTLMA